MKWIAIILLLAGSAAQAQTPDFTGSWKRNNERSDAGEHISINSIPATIEVKTIGQSLFITAVSKNAKGEVSTVNDTLKLDGSLSQRLTASGLHRTSRYQPAAKGFAVITEYRDDAGTLVRNSKEVWTLTDDGKLQIISDFELNSTALHFIEVFDK